jgi:signal transduction histidine kinase
MYQLVQALWDQMRADLSADGLPQLQEACQALLNGRLGPLTDVQREDLESVQRSADKLAWRFAGAPINWADYSEAAHALRGPLNATIGFSRLMLLGVQGPITAAQGEALETIYGVSRRLLALFNLLLEALLFHEGDIEPKIEAVQIGPLLEELVGAGHTLTDGRDLSFEAQLNDAVAQTTLHSDAQRLKQTLLALLAVAAKYTHQGMLILKTQVAEEKLLFQIESHGCQMPAPFLGDLALLLTAQADLTLPYDTHLRLGLARRSIVALGGQLELQRREQACFFTVILPAA